ncbi:hypothetical protein CEXT_627181 [Caerostris extrusa]|uniref:Uncharacterized protein n=1 Tax=Caerostris extrusa TaxID=172846 RepID=A0AAV4X3Q4_CAEEX|nr:hypothetical protein CEXT_627181 [Caerostris extrusa]
MKKHHDILTSWYKGLWLTVLDGLLDEKALQISSQTSGPSIMQQHHTIWMGYCGSMSDGMQFPCSVSESLRRRVFFCDLSVTLSSPCSFTRLLTDHCA